MKNNKIEQSILFINYNTNNSSVYKKINLIINQLSESIFLKTGKKEKGNKKWVIHPNDEKVHFFKVKRSKSVNINK